MPTTNGTGATGAVEDEAAAGLADFLSPLLFAGASLMSAVLSTTCKPSWRTDYTSDDGRGLVMLMLSS